MEFEWDAQEAQTNRNKHGVMFELAVTIFDDPYSLRAAIKNIQSMRNDIGR